MKFYYKISIAIFVSIFYKIKGARKRQKKKKSQLGLYQRKTATEIGYSSLIPFYRPIFIKGFFISLGFQKSSSGISLSVSFILITILPILGKKNIFTQFSESPCTDLFKGLHIWVSPRVQCPVADPVACHMD